MDMGVLLSYFWLNKSITIEAFSKRV